MPGLSLTERRLRARGLNARLRRAWGERRFMSLGNRASLTTALAGANNDLTVFARTPGTAGNALQVRIVVAGNNTPLSVGVSGNLITVNSATNGSAAATSTAEAVRRAINESPTVSPLIWAQAAPGNDGTGVVAALAATNLAGAA